MPKAISQTQNQDKPVICQLVHTLNVGGAEILARQFAERARHDFNFVFVCLDSAGVMAEQLDVAGYPVEMLGRRPGFDLACAWRLRKVCLKHHVQLIHAHQYAPFFYAGVSRWMRGQTTPILFTEHGRDFPDQRRLKRVLANRLLLRSQDRVVAVGECVRESLTKFECLHPDRISVILNGINVDSYSGVTVERSDARARLGLEEDEVAVIHVARLNALKDHGTALRAMARLTSEFPRTKLLVVGEGEERGMIERLICELHLGERVSLLGLRGDIAELLAASDIFLLTSISEGIPLTIIEAMAAGLPCVSTAVGGTPEVIADRETGYLARAGDPQDVAEKLKLLVAQPTLRHSMGLAGRQRASQQFSDRQMHQAYQSLYRQMTRMHPRVSDTCE